MPRKPFTPTSEQFETAIMWLEANNGTDGEADACHAVARWLGFRQTNELMRQTARAAGVPVAELRRRLAGQGAAPADEEEN